MPAKKKSEQQVVHLNVAGHTVVVNSDMSEDQITAHIWFALQCHDHKEQLTKDFQTSNTQLSAENDWYAEENTKLNFNIEIQVMMLNEIKKIIWDDKYKEIRDKVTSSPEFLKLKERAWL